MLDVGPDDMLPIGGIRKCAHDNRQFVLVRIGDGTYHAVRNICPHQGVDLGEGVLVGHNEPGEVGSHDYVETYSTIRCPRHGYGFDVTTGCSWFDPERIRIKAYDVRVADGRVLVDI